MPAEPHIFGAYRALARALAQLAPLHRSQAVAAAAQALADGAHKTVSELRPILSDEDFAIACGEAVRILRTHNSENFRGDLMPWESALIRFVSLRLKKRYRRDRQRAKGPQKTNT